VVGSKPPVDKVIVEETEILGFGLIFHGTGKNGIAIVDIADKDVAMAKPGGDLQEKY
jgi:hypothetical protein